MRWPIGIALRFFWKDRTRTLLIATITIGVLALSTVLSIMNGFQFSTIDNILNIDSFHLIAYNDWERSYENNIITAIREIPAVVSALPFGELHTIAHRDEVGAFPVRIRALPRDAFQYDYGLADALNLQIEDFNISPQTIIIGSRLAQRFGLTVGDGLVIFSHRGAERVFTVANIFTSGHGDYDSHLIFTTIDSARRYLNATMPAHIGIKFDNPNRAHREQHKIAETMRRIIRRTPQLRAWQESNRAIFGALRLEKFFMILTVGMIFIVVSINIYQSLTRRIMQRTPDIALLMAVGATHNALYQMLTTIGLFIGIIGGLIGSALGLLITININSLFDIAELLINGLLLTINQLAYAIHGTSAGVSLVSSDYFYFFNIPHQMVLAEYLSIFIFGVTLSTLAAYYASRHINFIKPATILGRI